MNPDRLSTPIPRARRPAGTIALFTAALLAQALAAPAATSAIRSAVVKIHATYQVSDYAMPWQSSAPGNGTGTGFIIKGRRILTNAHVVSNSRFLEVQKDGSPTRYAARVQFIGHDCDLAVLSIPDASFFEDTRPVSFARHLPELEDEVTAIGYPMGGDRLSITRGVVSRIDYGVYAHSGVDQHLVLQVDAAINPGNSGGPVIFDGDVVGVAFQGLQMGDNIGYAIPLPVVEHFLKDIEDGTYHGYPELGVSFLGDSRNAALRSSLGLSPDQTGAVCYYVDPFGSARGFLQEKDVLLSIDGYPIADDATINLKGIPVLFAELLERKQWGESAVFNVWRDKAPLTVRVPLTNPFDPFVYRNLYDVKPRYFVKGGLVFSPLTSGYLRTLSRERVNRSSHLLFYLSEFAKVDGFYKDRDEFVVISRRLPHPVNTYADPFVNAVVTEINGQPVPHLAAAQEALRHPQGGFHVIRFEGMEDSLVLDAAGIEAADPLILNAYRVPAPAYLGEVHP